ncbi:MAG TPA: hypothetical protein VFD36_30525, partial [Kofleriaceae bacterium]|nr:hypothetical protein [Kofleriaceae bacterium]
MTRGREAASGEPRGPGRRTQVGLLEQTATVAHPPGAPRDADAAPGGRTRVGEGSSPGLGLDGEASGGMQAGANAAAERDGEAASAQIAYYLQMRRRSGGSLALADGASRPPEQARFDDMRVQGLSTMLDVATAYGGPPLASATLGAADPPIASAASRGIAAGGPEGAARASHAAAGHAMWRASERYAASMYRRAVDGGDIAHSDPAVELALQRCGSGQSLPREVQRSMEG